MVDPNKSAKENPLPLGINQQYDALFRSYQAADAGSDVRWSEFNRRLNASIEKLRSSTTPAETESRFLFGRFVHRFVARLLLRHFNARVTPIQDAVGDLACAIESLSQMWTDVYAHEFEVERRTAMGIVDRLAVLDSMQVQLEMIAAHLDWESS